MSMPEHLRRQLAAYEHQRTAAAEAEKECDHETARIAAARHAALDESSGALGRPPVLSEAADNRIVRQIHETARFLSSALIKHDVAVPTIAIAQAGGFLRSARPLLSGWSVSPEYAPAKPPVFDYQQDENSSFPHTQKIRLAAAESSYASGIVLDHDGTTHVYKIAPAIQRPDNTLLLPHTRRPVELDGNGNLSYQQLLMPSKSGCRTFYSQSILSSLEQLADTYFQVTGQGIVPRPEPLRAPGNESGRG